MLDCLIIFTECKGVGGDVSSAGVGVAKAGKKKKAKAAASSSADTLDGAKKPPQQKRLDIMNAKVRK